MEKKAMQEDFIGKAAEEGEKKMEEAREEVEAREEEKCKEVPERAGSLEKESLDKKKEEEKEEEKEEDAAAESSEKECSVLEESAAEKASPGECCADGELGGLASREDCKEGVTERRKDEEDPDRFDVHFFLGVLDECMFLYIAFLCGSQAKSFLLGLGVYFLMELKRVVVAACVGDGSGPVPFSRLERDDKAVRACYKRSVWLDSLLTLSCCVAVKMGWIALW
jgi:hypothetical protein